MLVCSSSRMIMAMMIALGRATMRMYFFKNGDNDNKTDETNVPIDKTIKHQLMMWREFQLCYQSIQIIFRQ